ncbi:MAG: hypothetical protein EAZ91_07815 [Cytophagales bacterium]|nr:MAG: hypothetical protein EAZ91_07815 [Cytophagales bacterium]
MRNFGYDLGLIVKTFDLQVVRESEILQNWLSATYGLDSVEQANMDALFIEAEEDGGYWNEEELKINFVGAVFRLAKVNVKDRIKVFYERPLSAEVQGHSLAVIADCLVATPLPFNTPSNPYFFLQEFKKRKGDKHDPEAQMLTAMLIAQEINKDNKPVYGGYLIGQNWNFTVLDGHTYCQSRQYDATRREDLHNIVYALRKLKEMLLMR